VAAQFGERKPTRKRDGATHSTATYTEATRRRKHNVHLPPVRIGEMQALENLRALPAPPLRQQSRRWMREIPHLGIWTSERSEAINGFVKIV
jgi:hypothetical protein